MTALRWDDIDLGSASLKVVAGKGGKTARVNLSSTLVEVLERVPLEQRTDYFLPARSRIAVYKRLEAACRTAKVKFKGVHALRHACGTRLCHETGDLALVADHLRHNWTRWLRLASLSTFPNSISIPTTTPGSSSSIRASSRSCGRTRRSPG